MKPEESGGCGCNECAFIEQQIGLARQFNTWMAGGFGVACLLAVGFILGVLIGWW